jgi:A/G-specific adenine glycosylase
MNERHSTRLAADHTPSRIIGLLTPPLLRWYTRNARPLPWRRTGDPYAIWISEVMLQQTQVRTVIPYYLKWMSQFPSIPDLARAPLASVLHCWAGLGYYRRARNLHAAAKALVSNFSGRFPADLPSIMTLPGIGRYTAGAICSIAFNQPAPILDGNIIRVFTRLFAIPGNPRTASVSRLLWNFANDWIHHAASMPSTAARRCAVLNQALMELGALICTPRNPDCVKCPLQTQCRALASGCPTSFPQLAPRPILRTRRYAVFILRHRSSVLAQRQPDDGWNAGLWGFPAIELKGDKKNPQSLLHRCLKVRAASDLRHQGTFRHSITKYRLKLDVYAATIVTPFTPARRPQTRWCRISTLNNLPLQAAHRKILRRLLPLESRRDWANHVLRRPRRPQL